MALRGKPPEAVQKRLKLFMFGAAGVGKSTSSAMFPNAYIIDCEKGTENYDEIIRASGSVVFHTTDMDEVIAEVKSLLTERHEYRTLVIDPITAAYNDLLEKSEAKVGTEFGRHYGEANKAMRRLANLLMSLDMNIIITAHQKKEYGQNLAVIGETFDGWKQLDYWFDLVIQLQKNGKKRFGRVVKTRIKGFPDAERFEWSYDEVKRRYGEGGDVSMLEKAAATVALATAQQVADLSALLSVVRLPEGTTEKWLKKANVDAWEDMPQEAIEKCIAYVRGRLPSGGAAAA